MDSIGLESARSRTVNSFEDAIKALDIVGLPAIIRPHSRLAAKAAVSPITAKSLNQLLQTGFGYRLSLKF